MSGRNAARVPVAAILAWLVAGIVLLAVSVAALLVMGASVRRYDHRGRLLPVVPHHAPDSPASWQIKGWRCGRGSCVTRAGDAACC